MRPLSRWLVLAGTLMALVFSAGATASANHSAPAGKANATIQTAVDLQQTCGFVGGETYRHCSTRTRVLIDAKDFWGTTYRNICVGPGDTHLGYLSTWVIRNAWYIGKTC